MGMWLLLGALLVTLAAGAAPETDKGKAPLVNVFGCRREDSCAACIRRPECGWCELANECLPGTIEAPSILFNRRSACIASPASWHYDACSPAPTLNRRAAMVPDALEAGVDLLNVLAMDQEADKGAKDQNKTADGNKEGNSTQTANGTASSNSTFSKCNATDTACLLKAQNEKVSSLQREIAALAESQDDRYKEFVSDLQKVHLLNLTLNNNSTNSSISTADATAATTAANEVAAKAILAEAKRLRKLALKLHPALAEGKNGTRNGTDSSKDNKESKFIELSDVVRAEDATEREHRRSRNPKAIRA